MIIINNWIELKVDKIAFRIKLNIFHSVFANFKKKIAFTGKSRSLATWLHSQTLSSQSNQVWGLVYARRVRKKILLYSFQISLSEDHFTSLYFWERSSYSLYKLFVFYQLYNHVPQIFLITRTIYFKRTLRIIRRRVEVIV